MAAPTEPAATAAPTDHKRFSSSCLLSALKVCGNTSLQMNEYELTAATDKLLCISVFMKTVFH